MNSISWLSDILRAPTSVMTVDELTQLGMVTPQGDDKHLITESKSETPVAFKWPGDSEIPGVPNIAIPHRDPDSEEAIKRFAVSLVLGLERCAKTIDGKLVYTWTLSGLPECPTVNETMRVHTKAGSVISQIKQALRLMNGVALMPGMKIAVIIAHQGRKAPYIEDHLLWDYGLERRRDEWLEGANWLERWYWQQRPIMRGKAPPPDSDSFAPMILALEIASESLLHRLEETPSIKQQMTDARIGKAARGALTVMSRPPRHQLPRGATIIPA